jgi:hypothetical protein
MLKTPCIKITITWKVFPKHVYIKSEFKILNFQIKIRITKSSFRNKLNYNRYISKKNKSQ